MANPQQGSMYLFDTATPPLADGSYRLTVGTDVTYDGGTPTPTTQSFSRQHYFDVVGPRFAVLDAMVAGTFPPKNGHGSFENELPHIVLKRRCLPWERLLDPDGKIGAPQVNSGDPPPLTGPAPWVALLVFEEGDNVNFVSGALKDNLPPDVFAALGSPDITCELIQVPNDVLTATLPSLLELQLLTHARLVNVDDRELNAAGGDGYYSVVVANRLPSPCAQCRAVLVSLEQRWDIVQANPPPTAPDGAQALPPCQSPKPASLAPRGADKLPNPIFALSRPPVHAFGSKPSSPPPAGTVSLVALYSWKFTCEGPGTFQDLMIGLDVEMFGNVQPAPTGAEAGHPALTDTGHVQIEVRDRLGASEQVWYCGPLRAYPLTREADTLAPDPNDPTRHPIRPYHSADQARRASPETGAEDVSYAAAFEVGRLLAAADARFARSVMAWRREAYHQSARASTITAAANKLGFATALPTSVAQLLHMPIAPFAAAAATDLAVKSQPLVADAYGVAKTLGAPGMDPAQLQAAWHLASADLAAALLGKDPGTLGADVSTPPQTPRPNTTIDAVAADAGGLARLSSARSQVIADAVKLLGGT